MAGSHLLERGFEHFGFCGVPEFLWSRERLKWFTSFLSQHKFECSVFPSPEVESFSSPADLHRALEQWVAGLPKPAGVMAGYDIRAQQLIVACRNLEIAVPEEVAVIGVDNDELLCDLCDPPLTSIILDSEGTGYKSAELLEQMMSGEHVPGDAHLFKPLGIVTRTSTDTLAMSDPEIVQAVHLIRRHACDGISVQDLLDRGSLSRRVFEQRFRQQVGTTPHQQIVQTQLDRVKDLLVNTKLNLADIAVRSGFKHHEYMSVVFKKIQGESPAFTGLIIRLIASCNL